MSIQLQQSQKTQRIDKMRQVLTGLALNLNEFRGELGFWTALGLLELDPVTKQPVVVDGQIQSLLVQNDLIGAHEGLPLQALLAAVATGYGIVGNLPANTNTTIYSVINA